MKLPIIIAASLLGGMMSLEAAGGLPQEPPTVPETSVAAEVQEPLNPPLIYEHWLPLDCYQPVPEEEQGTILEDQVPGHEEHPHRFTVYLPPHYDENKQYNLMVFMGPSDGKPGDCIGETFDTWYTDYFRFADIYDQLILRRLTEPFILVQPDYLSWQDLEINYDTVSQSIEDEFLPYVAEQYATYAENGSHEALVAARDHIAMGGASLGGMYIFRGLLPQCTDVCAWFCPMSCQIDITKVQGDILMGAQEHPVKGLYYVYGGYEEEKLQHMGEYMRNVLPEVFTEENVVSLELEGTHHYYSTWAAGLWNTLQFMWKESAGPTANT